MELSTARRWKLKRERSKEKKAVDLWKTQLSLPQIHTTNYNKSCFIFYKILSKQRGELYALGFGIIGLLIGVLAGVGETRYYKKSQREDILPINMIVCDSVFAVVGAALGFSLGDNERKEKTLGLNTAATDYYKQGRYWTAMTKWIDPESRRQCIISTNKDQSGELVSVLNYKGERSSLRHSIYSGSQINVQKAHSAAIQYYWKQLKATIG